MLSLPRFFDAGVGCPEEELDFHARGRPFGQGRAPVLGLAANCCFTGFANSINDCRTPSPR